MWNRINDVGIGFWLGIKRYPWADDLYKMCCKIAPVTIFTSNSRHPSCAYGKIAWLRDWLGIKFRDYMIGPRKHLAARPGSVLIDDNEKMIDTFKADGGETVLFPRQWNRGGELPRDPAGYVADALADLAEK